MPRMSSALVNVVLDHRIQLGEGYGVQVPDTALEDKGDSVRVVGILRVSLSSSTLG